MIGLTSQWTILERLEWESLQAEIRELSPKVDAGDEAAWQRSLEIARRVQELVKVAHARAARPQVEADAR